MRPRSRRFRQTIIPSTTTRSGPHATVTPLRHPWASGAGIQRSRPTLLRYYIGESVIAFTVISCKLFKEVYSADILYLALEVFDLTQDGDKGIVTTPVTIYNQKNELVLSEQHK
jgi:acyl dehydratase